MSEVRDRIFTIVSHQVLGVGEVENLVPEARVNPIGEGIALNKVIAFAQVGRDSLIGTYLACGSLGFDVEGPAGTGKEEQNQCSHSQ